jgi:hypothetical protein
MFERPGLLNQGPAVIYPLCTLRSDSFTRQGLIDRR